MPEESYNRDICEFYERAKRFNIKDDKIINRISKKYDISKYAINNYLTGRIKNTSKLNDSDKELLVQYHNDRNIFDEKGKPMRYSLDNLSNRFNISKSHIKKVLTEMENRGYSLRRTDKYLENKKNIESELSIFVFGKNKTQIISENKSGDYASLDSIIKKETFDNLKKNNLEEYISESHKCDIEKYQNQSSTINKALSYGSFSVKLIEEFKEKYNISIEDIKKMKNSLYRKDEHFEISNKFADFLIEKDLIDFVDDSSNYCSNNNNSLSNLKFEPEKYFNETLTLDALVPSLKEKTIEKLEHHLNYKFKDIRSLISNNYQTNSSNFYLQNRVIDFLINERIIYTVNDNFKTTTLFTGNKSRINYTFKSETSKFNEKDFIETETDKLKIKNLPPKPILNTQKLIETNDFDRKTLFLKKINECGKSEPMSKNRETETSKIFNKLKRLNSLFF